MIPNLSLPVCRAVGTLVKISIHRDPDGTGPDDLLYDLDVGWRLDPGDVADLARLDAVVPGAEALARSAAMTQRRTRISDAVDRGDRFVSVCDAAGGSLVVARRCEVRTATVRVAGPLVTVTARLRVRGLDVADAARLARELEREVEIDLQTAQQTLTSPASARPAARPSATGRGWTGGSTGIGLVVSAVAVLPGGGRREVCGVVVDVAVDAAGIAGDTLVVEDGPSGDPPDYVVAADVKQTTAVGVPSGLTIAEVVSTYQTTAAGARVPASWRLLLLAAAGLAADGALAAGPGGEWTIDDAVVARAVQIAKAEQAA